ncbi:Dabb family protein [Paenibacillus spongiae]|uniref:Dabb family protein n=1 Tax=Paenibacillus spongiae TaxID=2909671 RepID=A0ABY5SAJ3_9BACL|nr:Dabb family protein [Paenibacillus spongiae]UVI30954.1 Dabb family protein [Paenibacillus spongiae]
MIKHLIVFNPHDQATHEDCLAMLAKGKKELSQIPGVVKVSYGVAVAANAKYKYTFEALFENESVIETYKHHPIHVKFADEDFRPMAVDRITTDYEIL